MNFTIRKNMSMKNLNFGLVLTMVLFFSLSTAITTGFNASRAQALATPLIIQTSEDNGVQTAVDTLLTKLENARIVRVTSEETLSRIVGSNIAIFIVGHGLSDGIGSQLVTRLSYSAINQFLRSYSLATSYIIACNAAEAVKELNLPSFGTPGLMDAEIAAYMALVKYAIDKNLGSDFVRELAKTLLEVAIFKPLSTYKLLGYWGPWEQIMAVIDFIVWFIATICGAAALSGNFYQAAMLTLAAGGGEVLLVAYYIGLWSTGQIDFLSFVSGCFVTLVSLAWRVIWALPWYIVLFIAAAFGAQVAIGGWTIALNLIISIGSIIFLTIRVVNDMNDNDPFYGISLW